MRWLDSIFVYCGAVLHCLQPICAGLPRHTLQFIYVGIAGICSMAGSNTAIIDELAIFTSRAEDQKNLLKSYILLTAVVLFIALSCRIGLDIYISPHQDFIASLVYFFPKQVIPLSFIIIAWHLFSNPRAVFIAQKTPGALPQNISVNTREPEPVFASSNILVMKGSGECLIEWRSIDSISACGNYMEFSCNVEKYLLRISMKQLEQRLPLDHFIRIHRSHIVNIAFYLVVLCGWPWICRFLTRARRNANTMSEHEQNEAQRRRELDYQALRMKWKSIGLLILFFEIVVIRQFGL